MQDNVITLAVDELNDDNTVNHVFTRFDDSFANRSVYIGENHQLTARDTLSLYRSFPKAAGNFPGVAKSSIKFSMDHVITGVDGISQLTSPIIVEVSFSVPVGIDTAAQLIARQRAVALLDRDDVMVPLMNQLLV